MGVRVRSEECRVLRATAGMNWGEQTGSDTERQKLPHPDPSPYDPLQTPHLSQKVKMNEYGAFFFANRIFVRLRVPLRTSVFASKC